MGGLFGIGGSAAKTDRKQQINSWGALQNLAGTETRAGGRELLAGEGGVNKAKDYWSALMSGDPTAMSKVLAPQISAIKGQSGQNIRGLQQFSGRSGGTSGAVQAENVEAMSAIQNLFDMLGPMAAEEFGKLSEFQTEAGSGLLGMAGENEATIGSQATGSRQTTVPQQQGQQAAVLQALGALAGLA